MKGICLGDLFKASEHRLSRGTEIQYKNGTRMMKENRTMQVFVVGSL